MAENKMKKTGGKTEELSLTAEKHEHGKHPNFLANLQPFEKGISGNPSGRPVKYAGLKNALDKWADEIVTYWFDGEKLPLREQVIYTIWNKARRGDPKMIEILATINQWNLCFGTRIFGTQ